MASLTLQKRLAMDLLKCGQRKVWLDPSKKSIIAEARSREAVRDLIAQDIIQSRPGYHGYKTKLDKSLNDNNRRLQEIKAAFRQKQRALLGDEAFNTPKPDA